jgi:protein PET117
MSRASKLTLLGTSLFAAGTVVFVHFQQQAEKSVSDSLPPSLAPAILFPLGFPPPHPPSPPIYNSGLGTPLTPPQAMHAGVIRDMENQRLKRERQADFEMQRELEAEYKKVQRVVPGDESGGVAKAAGAGDPGP